MPALRKLKQDHKSNAILGFIQRSCNKQKQSPKQNSVRKTESQGTIKFAHIWAVYCKLTI